MPVHAFVDETQVRGLLVVAAVLEPRDVASSRQRPCARLLLPRRSRLHLVKERDARKRLTARGIEAACNGGGVTHVSRSSSSALLNPRMSEKAILFATEDPAAARGHTGRLARPQLRSG